MSNLVSVLLNSLRSVRFNGLCFLSATLLIFPACGTFSSHLNKKPFCAISENSYWTKIEVRQFIADLQQLNHQLKTFKGIGTLRVLENGRLQGGFRVAWIGADQNRIRIAMLFTGRPALHLACDGQWLYYQDTGSSGSTVSRRKYTKGSDLRAVIKIPVKLEHVISILKGQVPFEKHDAFECESAGEENRFVLTLKQWWTAVEKISLDGKTEKVHAVEVYDARGDMLYRACFEKMQLVDGFQVPARIVLTNNNALTVQIDIERYMANVPVNESAFILKPHDREAAGDRQVSDLDSK